MLASLGLHMEREDKNTRTFDKTKKLIDVYKKRFIELTKRNKK